MKIFKYYLNNPDVDIAMQDYSLIGFKKTIKYERGGRKSEIKYHDEDGVNVIKLCEDVVDDSGELIEIKHTHQWLGDEGEIELEKTTYAEIDATSRGSILRKRRQRNIDHLNQISKNTPLEQVVGLIFDTFKDEVNKYVQIGSTDLLQALMASQLNELSLPTGFDHPTEGRKLLVKEIMAYEIS